MRKIGKLVQFDQDVLKKVERLSRQAKIKSNEYIRRAVAEKIERDAAQQASRAAVSKE